MHTIWKCGQAIAGIKQGLLFDEFDHLGAYLTKNRFDLDIIDQSMDENSGIVICNGMSGIVDQAFESEQWETEPKPTQKFPSVVLKVLSALDISREPGWLSVDSLIRNFGEEARNNFAKYLSSLDKTIEHTIPLVISHLVARVNQFLFGCKTQI